MRFFASIGEFLRARSGAALVAAAMLVLAGYYFFDGTASAAPAITVAPADFETTVAVSGTVTAAQNVDLGFAANGRVSGAYASVGQWVPVGTLLAKVENGDLVAALAEQEANLSSLQAGTRPEQLAVDQAAVAGAESALADALRSAYTTADDAVHNKTDAFLNNPRTNPTLAFTVTNATLVSVVENDRTALEPLLAAWKTARAILTSANAGAAVPDASARLAQVSNYLADLNAALNQGSASPTVSAATLATYAATLATERAALDSSASALSAAAASLTSSEKTLALAAAGPTADDVRAQEAAVDAALAAVAKTEVRAPFSGVVTRMDAKVGEIVSPTTADISMQSDELYQVEAYVPEVSVSGVMAGNPATTTLDAYGTAVMFPLKVISVDPAETLQNGVPTYKTTLTFLTPDARVRSGMTANVIIGTGVRHDAIIVPRGAVGYSAGAPYVSVLVSGKAVRRSVTLGGAPALGQIEVASGLVAGDRVLLSPQ